jgi:hypothetical protein
MPAVVTEAQAREILGPDVLGSDEVAAAFGKTTGTTTPAIPFSATDLAAGQRAEELLVLRVAAGGDGSALTILALAERFPQAFDQKLLRQVGYQLKEEWGIAVEPLAATDTCVSGWALVRKDVLAESRNLSYDAQTDCLQRYGPVRRRTAVEAVYDTTLYFAARNVRLLATTWDWTASRTTDGSYLNVGGFGPQGMQILGFSRGIRHGGLGVCPTRQPQS